MWASLGHLCTCPERDFHTQDATPQDHTLIQFWTSKRLQNNASLRIMNPIRPLYTDHERNVGQNTEAWPV